MHEELAITKQVGIIRPLVDLDGAVDAFNEYQKLKQRLRGPGDFIAFKDRSGNDKEAPTKQWRSKLTRFFGISCDIVREEMEVLNDGSFVVRVTAKASAPNGLYMFGDGSCWSKTKEGGSGDLYHNTRSHAITRAKNRAVLELVGFGEVSAEEIDQNEVQDTGGQRAQGSGPRNPDAPSTEKQQKAVYAAAKSAGIGDVKAWLKERYGVESTKDLTKGQASDALDALKGTASKPQASGTTPEVADEGAEDGNGRDWTEFWKACTKVFGSVEAVNKVCQERYGKASARELSQEEFDSLLAEASGKKAS